MLHLRKNFTLLFSKWTCGCQVKKVLQSTTSEASVRLGYTDYDLKNVTAAGNPSPMLILHGMFGSQTNWRSLAKAISKSGRRVITVDARNHGESPHHPVMTYEAMAADVYNLALELSLKKVTVVGHSMGGKTAMCLALRQPQLVDKLVVVDSAPEVSPSSTTFEGFLNRMRSLPLSSVDASGGLPSSRRLLLENPDFSAAFPESGVRQFMAANLRLCPEGGLDWTFNLEAVRTHADHLLGFPDFFEKQYSGPCLFIGGELSPYLRTSRLSYYQRLFPRARLVFVSEAGHWVHSDQPKAFLQELMTFVTSDNSSEDL